MSRPAIRSTGAAAQTRVLSLIVALDLGGTFVFAVGGALAAVQHDLDLLGVIVLSFATALGGGIIRDVLIGAAPPAALCDRRYPLIAITAAVVTFFLFENVSRTPTALLITLDAAGLAIFAVAGSEKALAFGIDPLIAILLGGVTAVGGGTLRDVLLARVPLVLYVDVYATAALFGAAIVVGGRALRIPAPAPALAGFIACFTLRLVSAHLGWNLPKVHGH